MKERVLSQENQKSLTDGASFTKLESIRQRYLNTRSSSISDDPGLVICERFWKTVWTVVEDASMAPHQANLLWMLLEYGPEVLKEHRNVKRWY